ncbi:methyltransferase domain-containing protein [archaeon]|jgi:ubiquinone/menaquinone biosynthesis C-methylase UbiE|nr:methyltransferase domain-containing protein [archaeon]MBT3731282.1 methyltransferase domain-containing protein [archaeon]MBT4669935.1 methyltransferase domain-containing protein [archaeon]MBT5029760.1 methyltransferase domain-containing protein [archaeon]MBT5287491.1 methyltransferase domain-containing protein [archaeon]
MYEELSKGYDELYGAEQLKKIEIIKPYLKGKILDLGAGTGILAKHFPNVTSLEPCKEMLDQAPEPKVLAKAEEIPFEDNSFDTIVSLTALHHCDIDKVISEIKRLNPKHLALTLLKKSKNCKSFTKKLHENFKLKEIDEGKDLIFIQIN